MIYPFIGKTGEASECEVERRGCLLTIAEAPGNKGETALDNLDAVATGLCAVLDILPKDLIVAYRGWRDAKTSETLDLVVFAGGKDGPDGGFLYPCHYPVPKRFFDSLDCESEAGAEAVRQLVALKEALR